MSPTSFHGQSLCFNSTPHDAFLTWLTSATASLAPLPLSSFLMAPSPLKRQRFLPKGQMLSCCSPKAGQHLTKSSKCLSVVFTALQGTWKLSWNKGSCNFSIKKARLSWHGSTYLSSFLPHHSMPQVYWATYRPSQNNHLISGLGHQLLLYLQCPPCPHVI